MRRSARRAGLAAALGLLALFLFIWLRAPALPPGLAQAGAGHHVRILRDTWGVPHVFGHTDADVAFGLAYAHAEDDFATIQGALLAARGRLASVYGRSAAPNDYMVRLMHVGDAVDGCDEPAGGSVAEHRVRRSRRPRGLPLQRPAARARGGLRLVAIPARRHLAHAVDRVPALREPAARRRSAFGLRAELQRNAVPDHGRTGQPGSRRLLTDPRNRDAADEPRPARAGAVRRRSER